MSLFKRLICLMSGKHSTTVFVRNLSGDEYYEWGGGRSLWKCANCGAIEACPFRNDDKGGKPMSAQLAQAVRDLLKAQVWKEYRPARDFELMPTKEMAALREALTAFEAAPPQAQLEKERAARQEAQSELARYKGLLASSRLDLMREMKEHGWTSPQQAQAPKVEVCDFVQVDGLGKLPRSDAESWLRHRAGIIEACRAEGYTIVTTAQGVQLMKLGKIAAQAPQAQGVPAQDGVWNPPNLTRAQHDKLVAIAKDCAACDPERHDYTRAARSSNWWPHEWVINAMQRAQLAAAPQAEPVKQIPCAACNTPSACRDYGTGEFCAAPQAESVPEREPLTDEQVAEALEAGGIELQRFMGGISGKKDCWTTAGSASIPKIAAVVRAIAAAPQAEPTAYSLDADPAGIRERVVCAITGALAYGQSDSNPAPEVHWLKQFWDYGREAQQWRETFWAVARALGCLPSRDVNGNAHVFRKAETLAAPQAEPQAQAPIDPDGEQSRAGFRAFDESQIVRWASPWQVWREAVKWAAPQQEQDKLDAERYRAVRDCKCGNWALCEWHEDEAGIGGYYRDGRAPNVVDASIDKARGET